MDTVERLTQDLNRAIEAVTLLQAELQNNTLSHETFKAELGVRLETLANQMNSIQEVVIGDGTGGISARMNQAASEIKRLQEENKRLSEKVGGIGAIKDIAEDSLTKISDHLKSHKEEADKKRQDELASRQESFQDGISSRAMYVAIFVAMFPGALVILKWFFDWIRTSP